MGGLCFPSAAGWRLAGPFLLVGGGLTAQGDKTRPTEDMTRGISLQVLSNNPAHQYSRLQKNKNTMKEPGLDRRGLDLDSTSDHRISLRHALTFPVLSVMGFQSVRYFLILHVGN